MTIETEGHDTHAAGETGTGSAESSESADSGDAESCCGSSRASGWSGAMGESSPLSDIQDLVGDLVDGVRSFAPSAVARHPRYDFVETEEAYLLVFDVPGMEREAVSVTTEGEEVVITGERVRPEWGEGSKVRRTERAYGKFRRTMRLPADVRLDDIRARLEAGILTVTLPRRVTGAGGRKVDIEG
jgi:HSP20 family protein